MFLSLWSLGGGLAERIIIRYREKAGPVSKGSRPGFDGNEGEEPGEA